MRALSLVNRSRAAKNMSLQFLETKALKTEDSAGIAAILASLFESVLDFQALLSLSRDISYVLEYRN